MEGRSNEQTLLNWLIEAREYHCKRVWVAGLDGFMEVKDGAIPSWFVEQEITRITGAMNKDGREAGNG